MPELPDITAYIEALQPRIVGQRLENVRIGTPFLLRTVSPSLQDIVGRKALGVSRSGKRIVVQLEDELYFVLHLMIAGRLHWLARDAKVAKTVLAVFEFPKGVLTLTEAGSKKRASLHIVRGRESLQQFARGGIEPLEM